MKSDEVKVESVERRDSACCDARRRRERLTDACVACSIAVAGSGWQAQRGQSGQSGAESSGTEV